MQRSIVVLVLGVVAVAGCLGAPGAETPATSTEPVGMTPTPTASTPTPTTTPTDAGTVSVEYVVRAGSIADNVEHVHVDFAVYFAERPEDVYGCTDGAPLMDNRYDPTPTPLPRPEGECKRFTGPRIDVASLDGAQSLGEFAASQTFSGGHTLVVHDVTVVLENGTIASEVYDTDFRAVTERTTPSGTYGVEFHVTDYAGSDRSLRWRFGVDSERFDAADE